MDANRPFYGFVEVPHMADIAIDVFAPNLPELFTTAVEGLYHILDIRKGTGRGDNIRLTIDEMDMESLLVSFLNELLFYAEQNKSAVNMDLTITTYKLQVEMELIKIQAINKEVKAATYNQVKIIKNKHGYQTRIVFDL